MAPIPRPQFGWQKPQARLDGEKILKARKAAQMANPVIQAQVAEQIATAQTETQETRGYMEAINSLKSELLRLSNDVPKIVPSGGGGKKTIAKVLGRDFPNLMEFDGINPTAAGLALLDDANAAAQRSTLGLGSAAVANLLDEDDFATDSATGVPSQQSVKAYVKNQQVVWPSRAYAIANFHPITAPDVLVTCGYAASGDGGGAAYKKVVAEPSHAAKLSLTLTPSGTAWYEIAEPEVDGRMVGMVDDGADSLDPGAPTTVRGNWVTGTSYAVNDLVWTGSPKLGYRCLTAHTSGTFATDLAAGKWVLGAFSGTNNTSAFANLVAFHEATGVPIRIAPGKYRVLNPSTTTDSAYVSLTAQSFSLNLDGVLLIDEDGTAGKNYNLLKSSNFGAASSYSDRQTFRIVGSGGVRGRWSHKPGGNTPDARAHVLAISGYANVHLEGWFFEDIAGSFSRASDMDGVYCNNMRGERVAKGGLRFLKANDARVTNNKLRHFGDDVIDIHAAGTAIRSRIYIAGNQTFDAESIIALGARETSIIGNQSAFAKSGAIVVGGRAGSEGDNAAMMIVVTGNTVTDPLMASADGSTLADNDGTQGAIVVGSVPASWKAGDYNGSSVNDPLSDDYYYNIDLDTTNVPRGGSIEVYGNPTRQTRPEATNFSDYGVGLCFHQDGWIDPAVTLAKRVPHGVSLLSDIENFRIDLNVTGFRGGAGIFFRFLQTTEAARNFSFRNGRVSGTVTDCLDGVSHSFWNGAAQSINFPVHFSDLHCDLDPYHVSAARSSATGGNWNNGATEATKNYGLRLASMRGFTVENSSFKNLWAPVYGDNSKANGIYRGNVLYGVRAGQGYSSSNYGIGDMVWSNDQFDLIEVASIPSAGSGTYEVFSRVATREGTVTLADDTATSITPPRPNGLISIVSNANSLAALFAYDVSSGVINAVGTSGSSVTLGTTALTGTTGTDVRANYAAVSDGKIYIENRIGTSRAFRYKFIDG